MLFLVQMPIEVSGNRRTLDRHEVTNGSVPADRVDVSDFEGARSCCHDESCQGKMQPCGRIPLSWIFQTGFFKSF